jgi:hypothetical protein
MPGQGLSLLDFFTLFIKTKSNRPLRPRAGKDSSLALNGSKTHYTITQKNAQNFLKDN